MHQLAKAVSPETSRYVHWGSTTQDVLDTGMVLQVRNGLDLLDEMLADLEKVLADLAKRDPRYLGRVRPLIAWHTENGSPAMQARGKRLLRQLELIGIDALVER